MEIGIFMTVRDPACLAPLPPSCANIGVGSWPYRCDQRNQAVRRSDADVRPLLQPGIRLNFVPPAGKAEGGHEQKTDAKLSDTGTY